MISAITNTITKTENGNILLLFFFAVYVDFVYVLD